MTWGSTILKEYIIINAMAVNPMKKSIRTENINGSALDNWTLNMNCLYLTIYMTRNAENVRGCSESKGNDMDKSSIEIKIEPKIVVSKETAEGCLKIVEMWVNAERNREIEADYIDECTVKFQLKGE